MNFADELREQERAEREKEEFEKENYDETMIWNVIDTIMRECIKKVREHELMGIFEYDSWGDSVYWIRPCRKSDIPRSFAEDSVKRVYGINPNNTNSFEKRLKKEISDRGLDSSRCELIPVNMKKRIGVNFLGFTKYEYSIIYVVWIEITW